MPTDPTTRDAAVRRHPSKRERKVLGWREWVALPDLGVESMKAKIDTGARTSSLHAFRLAVRQRDGEYWATFEVHPHQRSSTDSRTVETRVMEFRKIRSSNGQVQQRPVIRTEIEVAGEQWPIDVTLTNRDEMGFRMLIGRAAIRRRFMVDPARSYLGGAR